MGRHFSVVLAGLLVLMTAQSVTATEAIHTLYLVRHGAYLPDAKADSQAGPGLSSLGIAQARLVATRLRSMPVAFNSLVSSTLLRARQTAATIHEQLANVPVSTSWLISECTPPARVPLRESDDALASCKRKLDEAFVKFFSEPNGASRHDVLVCHGNVIRYLTAKALGVDASSWIAMSVAHTSITVIQVLPNDVYRVVSVGDVGHVPPTLQSWGDDADPQLITPDTSDIAAR